MTDVEIEGQRRLERMQGVHFYYPERTIFPLRERPEPMGTWKLVKLATKTIEYMNDIQAAKELRLADRKVQNASS
jgi:hypothetical protein